MDIKETPFGRRQMDRVPAYNGDDEISLVDLFRVLIRNRALIILITVTAAVLAGIYATVKPRVYEYSVNIDIGSINEATPDGPANKLIETPENVIAKLTDSYIPRVLANYHSKNPEDNTRYQIDTVNPKGSSLIQLKASGPATTKGIYKELMGQVVNEIIADHDKKTLIAESQLRKQYNLAKIELDELQDKSTKAVQNLALESRLAELKTQLDALQDPRLTSVSRQQIETELKQEQQKLANIQGQATIIHGKIDRLEQTRELLSKQIKDLQQQIASALERRQIAEKQLGDESRAMTMLLIDNEIQQNRDHLAGLEERLHIDLANRREELNAELDDNAHSQSVQKQVIATVQNKLDNFQIQNANEIKTLKPQVSLLEARIDKQSADQQREIARKQEDVRVLSDRLANIEPTRAVSDMLASWRPVGPGRSVIVVIGLLLGLMLGVITAFFREFIQAVNGTNARGLTAAAQMPESADLAPQAADTHDKIKTFSKSSA